MVVAAALLGDVWLWLALPVGLAYGLRRGAAGQRTSPATCCDRRMPELLATVTPRR